MRIAALEVIPWTLLIIDAHKKIPPIFTAEFQANADFDTNAGRNKKQTHDREVRKGLTAARRPGKAGSTFPGLGCR